MLEKLKNSIPFQLKRGTSVISILSTIVIIGALERVGSWVVEFVWKISKPIFPDLINMILRALTYKFEVNVIAVIFFTLLLFPLYNYIDKTFLKFFKTQIIFRDKNFNAWFLNYWGSKNQHKTNRIENEQLIFEATAEDLENDENQFGAFYDLRNGIYEGNKYEISCQVKSENNCTMKFQLWVHDTVGGPGKSIIFPNTPITPKETWETIKVIYIAGTTNALRIHLHNYGGQGRIIVKEVLVRKVE
jgi:hypothetical protein